MIVWEEEAALRAHEDLILPLGVIQKTGEPPCVTADPAFGEEALWLDSLPEGQLFTAETADALLQRIAGKLTALGYEGEVAETTVYRLSERAAVNRTCIREYSEPLMPDHPYRNQTDCEPDPLGDGLLCFGTVIDGVILSAASENPHDEGDTVIDIGVETAPDYEGRGFAASNVAALAYYLLDPGITVTYIVEDNNPASKRVAEKVGFLPYAKELRVVGWRGEERA